ncbi:MAG: HIT domain-containing protein [Candidatus Dormiibacterota bacterium]
MEHLHAPWRMAYIGGPEPPGCLFCRVREAPAAEDETNLLLLREPEALVMLNKFPYNAGHLLVAPRAHVGTLTDLDDEQTLALMQLVRRSLHVLQEAMSPGGFNVGVNIGRPAGAGIPDHVHFHVVPRWDGDANFMPVIGEVKVVNEHLQQTWANLRAGFGQPG